MEGFRGKGAGRALMERQPKGIKKKKSQRKCLEGKRRDNGELSWVARCCG
jgi:hypothetical protein